MAIKRSALLPDDISDFEEAAADDSSLGPLAPPYDPRSESRTHAKKDTGSGDQRVHRSATTTRQLSAVLKQRDRFRLKVMKGHIKWARKWAIKNGIDPQEVDLWQL